MPKMGAGFCNFLLLTSELALLFVHPATRFQVMLGHSMVLLRDMQFSCVPFGITKKITAHKYIIFLCKDQVCDILILEEERVYCEGENACNVGLIDYH